AHAKRQICGSTLPPCGTLGKQAGLHLAGSRPQPGLPASRVATMLSISISNKQQRQQFEHAAGPIEFGRGPRREARRLMIEDIYVSRDQLRVEELGDGRVRVENLSQRREVALEDGTTLAVGSQRDFALPLRMTV